VAVANPLAEASWALADQRQAKVLLPTRGRAEAARPRAAATPRAGCGPSAIAARGATERTDTAAGAAAEPCRAASGAAEVP